jgi:hypothetical protein
VSGGFDIPRHEIREFSRAILPSIELASVGV